MIRNTVERDNFVCHENAICVCLLISIDDDDDDSWLE